MSVTDKKIAVAEKDLPICCPPEGEKSWNLHPRVYLKPNRSGVARCPYCSTEYQVAEAKE